MLSTGQGFHAVTHNTTSSIEGTKTEVMFTLKDRPGALKDVLAVFDDQGISLTHLESKPSKGARGAFDFFAAFAGSPNDSKVQEVVHNLKLVSQDATVAATPVVPWFPSKISDLDSFSGKVLDAGGELESDHPGFSDEAYRARRASLVDRVLSFRHGDAIPRVEYTDQETETWGIVYKKLQQFHERYAVEEFRYILPLLESNCGYAADNIPQLEDISQFLRSTTGFSVRPVTGLLSARDFLNALAFRVFYSTQYIRHHSVPLYTPEPDVVHELLGHVPMFADPDFAEFSHQIGLASLGASDNEIKKLASCYWFSVEFGLCNQRGEKKAYGAGLLSSFGELEYSCSPTRPAGGTDDMPEYLPWEPDVAARTDYPITTYQPRYFVAESLEDAKDRMIEYCEHLPRPFNVIYDPFTQSVSTDRPVVRGEYSVTMQTGNYM